MRRSIQILAAFTLAAAMIFAGCGSSASNSSSSSVLTVVPSPAGDFTNNFNPFLAPPQANYGAFGLVYESLLQINRLNGTIKPWLATQYQFSPDNKTLTFTLRQGVKWNDGQPFSASDVVFTFNLMKQFPAIDGNAVWKDLVSVTNSDPNTVVMTFNKPGLTDLWYIAGQTPIVPQHVWSTYPDPSKATNQNPVGTGPYKVGSFTPQVFTYVKNSNYWNVSSIHVDTIRYPAVASNTSADLVLQTGGLDWAGVFTPDIQTWAKNNPNNHFYWPAANVINLYFNLTKAPYNDVAFRQAVSAVIDRQQLVTQGESGLDVVANPTELMLPAQQSFLDSQFANASFGSPNVAQAQTILNNAGYKKNSSGQYLDKNGNPIKFQINVVTGWTDWDTDTQIMAQELTQLGFQVTPNVVSFSQYISSLQNGSFDAAISWTNPGPTPYYLFNSLLSSSNTAPIGQNASSNYWRYSNPQTDQLLNQLATSSDPATQQQALNGLESVMVNDIPVIPLFDGAMFFDYSTARYTGWPTVSNPYAAPAPYEQPDLEYVVLNLQPTN